MRNPLVASHELWRSRKSCSTVGCFDSAGLSLRCTPAPLNMIPFWVAQKTDILFPKAPETADCSTLLRESSESQSFFLERN